MDRDENWKEIVSGTTIGYKRLLRFEKVLAKQVKLVFHAEGGVPAISEIGVFLSSREEPSGLN